MDVPIALPLLGQLGIPDREHPLRNGWCEDDMDECVSEKRADDFVDVEGESREVEVICERLYSLTEPWYWWDGKWIFHGSGEGMGRRKAKRTGDTICSG